MARTALPQWLGRIFSIPVFGFWFFILFFLTTNTEDFTPASIPLIIAIAIALVCIVLAWRWSYWGGIALMVSAVGLLIAALYLIDPVDSAAELYLLAATSLPFFSIGLLFMVTHRR